MEDTGKKREIKGSDLIWLNELKKFYIIPDEGNNEFDGKYGPYKQSLRSEIIKL